MRKKIKFCLFPMLFFSFLLFGLDTVAQTGTMKVMVKDASGSSLSGASITVSGKNQGTLTDGSGSFTLKLVAGS